MQFKHFHSVNIPYILAFMSKNLGQIL